MTAGCTHPHLYALERYSHADETTVPAQWCSACGALCDDGVWRQPTLQAEARKSMAPEQLEAIDRLLSAGAVADEKVRGAYWLHNHCFLVKPTGEIEEL